MHHIKSIKCPHCGGEVAKPLDLNMRRHWASSHPTTVLTSEHASTLSRIGVHLRWCGGAGCGVVPSRHLCSGLNPAAGHADSKTGSSDSASHSGTSAAAAPARARRKRKHGARGSADLSANSGLASSAAASSASSASSAVRPAVCADGISDVDGHLTQLPTHYTAFGKMLKIFPVTARSDLCAIAAVQLRKAERCLRANNLAGVEQALEEWLGMPRKYLPQVRAGKAHTKQNTKTLEKRVAAAAMAARAELQDRTVVTPGASLRSEDKDGKMDAKHSAARAAAAAPSAASSSSAASSATSSVAGGAGAAAGGRGVCAREAEAMRELSAFYEKHMPILTEGEKRACKAAFDRVTAGQRHAIHYAVKSLVNQSMFNGGDLSEDDFIACDSLHPKRKRAVRALPSEAKEHTVVVDRLSLADIIHKKVANGSQPGPSGMTGEMLSSMMRDDRCSTGITALVQALIDGTLSARPRVRSLVLASRLVLATKYAADGVTKRGLRPIAMGEALWKAAVLYAKAKMELNTPLLFDDIQFGVQWRGGCEVAVIGMQSALNADKRNVAVLMDLSNAFNTRERADIAAELYARPETKPLWKLFDFAYARSATPLLVYGAKGKLRYVQSSDNGVRQGDPLASLLYALSMQRIYERSRDASGDGVWATCTLFRHPRRLHCCWDDGTGEANGASVHG